MKLKKNIVNLFINISIIFFFIFLIFKTIFTNSEIIYGGNISLQYHHVVNDFFNNISKNVYPFFSFNYPGTIDYLGESQQSLAHPLKILIAISVKNFNFIDTYFIIINLILMYVGLYKLLNFSKFLFSIKDDYLYNYPVILLTFSFVFSQAIFANYVHVMFISVISSAIFVVYYVLKLFHEINNKYLIKLFFFLILFLLSGHYGLQWIFLLLILILCVSFLFTKKTTLKNIVIIFSVIILSFLFCAPQIFSTFSLMLNSSRSTTGSLTMFLQSANPLNFLSYVNPYIHVLIYKFSTQDFVSWTYHNLVEGVHYVGTIPLISIIYLTCTSSKFSKTEKDILGIFSVTSFFMFCRALGIFFLLNIILNMLPIFGQFRVPIRTFFILDLILILCSLPFFYKKIEHDKFLNVINILIYTNLGLIFYCLLLIFYNNSFTDLFNNISLSEFFSIFFNLFILMFLKIIFLKTYKKNLIILSFFFIALIDTSVNKKAYPTHWYTTSIEKIKGNYSQIDEFCLKNNLSSLITTYFSKEFDKPISKLTNVNNDKILSLNGKKEIETLGYNCMLMNSAETSTLTPILTKKIMGSVVMKDFKNFSILGYRNVLDFNKENKFKVFKTEKVIDSKYFKYFIDEKKPNEKLNERLLKYYSFFKKLNIDLPSKNLETFKFKNIDGNYLFLNKPHYFIFKNRDKIINYNYQGSLIKFDKNISNVNVVYIPYPQIHGFIFTLIGIFFFSLILILNKKNMLSSLDIIPNKFSIKINYLSLKDFFTKNIKILNFLLISGTLSTCIFLKIGFIYFNKIELIFFYIPLIIFYFFIKKILQLSNYNNQISDFFIYLLCFNFAIGYLIFTIIKFINKNYFWTT